MFLHLWFIQYRAYTLHFGTLDTSSHLRVYPPKFVGKILEMKDEFIKAMPELPEVLLPILYCT
jgi:hypothetical protein